MANGTCIAPFSKTRILLALNEIPNEILFLILEVLDDDDLYAISSACKQLHQVVFPVYLSRKGVSPFEGHLILFNIFSQDAINAIHRSLFKPSLNCLSCTFDLCRPSKELNYDFETLLHLLDKLLNVREVHLKFGYLSRRSTSEMQLQERAKVTDDGFLPVLEERVRDCEDLFDAVLHAGCKSMTVTLFKHKCTFPAHDVEEAVHQETRKHSSIWRIANGNYYYPPPKKMTKLETFQVHSSMLFHPLLIPWTLRTLNFPSLTCLSFDQLGHLSPYTWALLLSSITLPILSKLSINLCLIPTYDLYRFLNRHSTLTDLYLGPTLLVADESASLPRNALKSLKILTATTSYLTSILSSQINPFPALSHVYVLHRAQHGSHFDIGLINNMLDPILRLRSSSQVRFSLSMESSNASWLVAVPVQGVVNSPSTSKISCFTRLELKVCVFRLNPSLILALPTWLSMFRRMTHFVLLTLSQSVDPFEEEYKAVFFRSVMMKCPNLEVIYVNDKIYEVDRSAWALY